MLTLEEGYYLPLSPLANQSIFALRPSEIESAVAAAVQLNNRRCCSILY